MSIKSSNGQEAKFTIRQPRQICANQSAKEVQSCAFTATSSDQTKSGFQGWKVLKLTVLGQVLQSNIHHGF
jgi:hypothetical protein